MNKIITLLLITFLSAPCVLAEGVGADVAGAAINSRIFSPQNAQPLDNLERSQYANKSIYNLEKKNTYQVPMQTTQHTQQKDNNTDSTLKKKKGGLFEGFRVIW